MNEYNFKEIEAKWQKIWEDEKYGEAPDSSDKPKFYSLVEFPYPSGYGLHVGHCMGYGASDAHARMKRLQGQNVLYPMGWDAFGLPTENFAIKNKVSPQEITAKAVETFKTQMKQLGYSFDWSREINTTDPAYYKWTQWIFLQFYRHSIKDGKLIEIDDNDKETPRLAFQAEMPVNWCPSCKIVLANEEVVGGACERCGTGTEKHKQKQWMLRITAYADRLIDDLGTVDYEERIKTQQINWIGKSVGTDIDFKIKGSDDVIRVFTTRADTLFGCTYVVLAPEHPLIEKLKNKISNIDEAKKYIDDAKKKSDLERTDLDKDKTGVKLEGVKAINPINNEEVDVFIADYCLANYGTGAVMAVPAHDQRDFEFAKKYSIDIKQVIAPEITYYKTPPREGLEWIERDAVESIVFNPKTNKYLALEWKNQPWTCFITGGIDENEDPVEAAKREILEETGYKNVKFIKHLGRTRLKFHAAHKNCNRLGNFQGLLFELVDDERIEPSDEEKAIHEAIWLSRDEISEKRMICASYEYWMKGLDNNESAFIEHGSLVNSSEFSKLSSDEAKTKITEKLKKDGLGDFAVNFKLRDWIFSRQHYWGEPIPIIHCEKCGTVPIDEKDLPLELPAVEKYTPSDTGESPLAKMTDWVNVKCPKCGGSAKRETDTMPNWAGSSWYFLRYCDPTNTNSIADNNKLKYWMPVDLYNGGMEHTTLHLLYSRFWHKFLFDLGVAPGAEPYAKRIAHGIILGPDGQKMSKSKGNAINPDEMVEKFGADTLRAYIMFIGPYDQESAWNIAGIQGVHRFLKRAWANQSLVKDIKDTDTLLVKLNQTIKGVTEDLETFQMNTVVSKLMELSNTIEKEKSVSKDSFKIFLQLLYPACPHITSELWEKVIGADNINNSNWPKPDDKYLVADAIEIAVQINGKTRQIITVKADASQGEVENQAKENQKIKNDLGDNKVKKVVFVAGRIINFVI